MTRIVHLNGALVPEHDARVSPFDRGLLLGDGVFETLRAYAGRPFALDEHLARLRGSCAVARLPMPDDLPRRIDETLRANGLDRGADAAVRVTLTRGPGGRGASPKGAGPPTILVTAVPIEPRPEAERGLRVATAARPAGAMAGVKAIDYLSNVVARIEAEEKGADDALFVDRDGFVVEATQANVLAIVGDDLVTPPLASGCLPGVTRAALLRLAPDAGLRASERPLRVADLQQADEVLLSGSVSEVLPVVEVDGARIGDGQPGRRTRALRQAYRALARGTR